MAQSSSSVTAPALPEAFVSYLAARERQQQERRAEMWAHLTDRERRLVREAAVMGYMQGTMGSDEPFPTDSTIVSHVLLTCDAQADLYPTLGGLGAATTSR